MQTKFLIPLLALLAACSTLSPAAPSGPETGRPDVSSPAPGLSTPVALASGPLALNILSPQDGAVVNTPQIELTGQVSREIVLTVNEQIYLLPPGDFSLPVALEEGANALEIVASDVDGNEITFILVITYQP